MIGKSSSNFSALLVCQHHLHMEIKGGWVFFFKYFLCYKCNYTRICIGAVLLRMMGTTLIVGAFNFTGCDIPCSRREQKQGQVSLRSCCVQVVHMQRVCHESEKTEACFSHLGGETCCVLAHLIRCCSAAAELAKHCLGCQFLIEIPTCSSKTQPGAQGGEREYTNSCI